MSFFKSSFILIKVGLHVPSKESDLASRCNFKLNFLEEAAATIAIKVLYKSICFTHIIFLWF
jgi:hypothetical protein